MSFTKAIKWILEARWLPLGELVRVAPLTVKMWFFTAALAVTAALLLLTADLLFGALVALLLALFALVLLYGLNRSLARNPVEHPTETVIRVFALIVVVSLLICAWVSYQTYDHRPGWYAPSSRRHEITDFIGLYAWHFIDMIPGLSAWETLEVRAPVEVCTVPARIPVLVFRVFVLFGVLASFLSWTKARRSAGERRAQSSPRRLRPHLYSGDAGTGGSSPVRAARRRT